MTKKKGLEQFEEAHGGPKIEKLKRELEVERKKVEALAGVQNVTTIVNSEDCHIRFALTGDRHHGSLYCHEAAIAGFYEHLEAEGVDTVFDCGDILDGHKVYKGQEFELRDLGLEAQLKRVKEAPVSIRTLFITGNHDASFKSAAGIPVGQLIELQNPEIYQFLGEEQARFVYQTPNGPFEIMLLHPGGGSSYALSYRPQKIVESLEGGNKPNLLAIGHYHKAMMIPSYRNVAVFQSGTFQKQTPFMARGGLAAHVGGWIIDVWVGSDHNRIASEFVAVYI